MSFAWPEVEIGSAADRMERFEQPVPGVTYRQAGVRLWGGGAYEREPMDGGDTKYRVLNRTEHGDIIVNKIWARHGSVSVVLNGLADCYVSGEFPLFAPRLERLDPRWFYWITRTRWFWNRCDEKSRGTSGKNRIRPEKFLDIKIPLPPLMEQRRLVAKIERLAAKVNEAREMRDAAAAGVTALDASLLAAVIPGDVGTRDLGELVQPGTTISYGVLKPGPDIAGGVPFVRVGDLSIDNPPPRPEKSISPSVDAGYVRTRLKGGEVLMAVVGSIGKVGIAPDSWAGANIARAVARIVPGPDVLPSYLASVLTAGSTQRYLLDTTRTLAQPTLNIKQLKETQIPVPPLSEQRRIVAYLDELQTKVDCLKTLQQKTAAELDALLPSILDKAFKGEL